MVGSSRYTIQKYEQLVNNFINLGSTELGDLVLTGNDLLDLAEAFGNINKFYDEYEEEKEKYENLTKEHKKLSEDYKNAISNLEALSEEIVDLKDPNIRMVLEKSLKEYFISQEQMPFNYPTELDKYMNGRDLIEIIITVKNDVKIIKQTKPNN